jgi:RNA polymerase sigma-54 factor
MRLSFGQHIRQSQVQKQIIAPKMIQSMEILQMPLHALEERIDQELVENPTLEVQEDDESRDSESSEINDLTIDASPESSTESDDDSSIETTEEAGEEFDRLDQLIQEYPESFDEGPRHSRNWLDQQGDRRHDMMSNIAERPETLHHHLLEQLVWFEPDEKTRLAAEQIIYALNANGFLGCSLEDVFGVSFDVNEEQGEVAREAIAIVQQLDPTGVGARNLQECLLLQLNDDFHYKEEIEILLTRHMEDLGRNRLPWIAQKTGYSLETIDAAMQEMHRLNPRPGSAYSETLAQAVTPDLIVEKDETGKYVVRMEDGRTPDLSISSYYIRMLKSQKGELDKDSRDYLRQKLGAAQWLIDSINQRRSTLMKVGQAIVDHQSRFLDEGPQAMEPLKMQQIADLVGVHVTTVSRAVDDKWIASPRGVFALRRFFGGGTTDDQGEDVSWDVVRVKIREIVDQEDKQKPLSDDAIVQALAKRGVQVARRTVTKYRKTMNIPSSRERKQWIK